MLVNEYQRAEAHRIVLNCQNVSYGRCQELASNLRAILSNTIFNKLASLMGLRLDYMRPQDSLLTLHEKSYA